ncbi:unnamed protein product [Amoebophrya sp. A120]|nr:unnamed protein product [Amoebophrya sp. A120]|eukprot:GSA120T00017950001.1
MKKRGRTSRSNQHTDGKDETKTIFRLFPKARGAQWRLSYLRNRMAGDGFYAEALCSMERSTRLRAEFLVVGEEGGNAGVGDVKRGRRTEGAPESAGEMNSMSPARVETPGGVVVARKTNGKRKCAEHDQKGPRFDFLRDERAGGGALPYSERPAPPSRSGTSPSKIVSHVVAPGPPEASAVLKSDSLTLQTLVQDEHHTSELPAETRQYYDPRSELLQPQGGAVLCKKKRELQVGSYTLSQKNTFLEVGFDGGCGNDERSEEVVIGMRNRESPLLHREEDSFSAVTGGLQKSRVRSRSGPPRFLLASTRAAEEQQEDSADAAARISVVRPSGSWDLVRWSTLLRAPPCGPAYEHTTGKCAFHLRMYPLLLPLVARDPWLLHTLWDLGVQAEPPTTVSADGEEDCDGQRRDVQLVAKDESQRHIKNPHAAFAVFLRQCQQKREPQSWKNSWPAQRSSCGSGLVPLMDPAEGTSDAELEERPGDDDRYTNGAACSLLSNVLRTLESDRVEAQQCEKRNHLATRFCSPAPSLVDGRDESVDVVRQLFELGWLRALQRDSWRDMDAELLQMEHTGYWHQDEQPRLADDQVGEEQPEVVVRLFPDLMRNHKDENCDLEEEDHVSGGSAAEREREQDRFSAGLRQFFASMYFRDAGESGENMAPPGKNAQKHSRECAVPAVTNAEESALATSAVVSNWSESFLSDPGGRSGNNLYCSEKRAALGTKTQVHEDGGSKCLKIKLLFRGKNNHRASWSWGLIEACDRIMGPVQDRLGLRVPGEFMVKGYRDAQLFFRDQVLPRLRRAALPSPSRRTRAKIVHDQCDVYASATTNSTSGRDDRDNDLVGTSRTSSSSSSSSGPSCTGSATTSACVSAANDTNRPSSAYEDAFCEVGPEEDDVVVPRKLGNLVVHGEDGRLPVMQGNLQQYFDENDVEMRDYENANAEEADLAHAAELPDLDIYMVSCAHPPLFVDPISRIAVVKSAITYIIIGEIITQNAGARVVGGNSGATSFSGANTAPQAAHEYPRTSTSLSTTSKNSNHIIELFELPSLSHSDSSLRGR